MNIDPTKLHSITNWTGGSPCGVVANVLDCDIIVSKFEQKSYYFVHFRTNTLGEGVELPPSLQL